MGFGPARYGNVYSGRGLKPIGALLCFYLRPQRAGDGLENLRDRLLALEGARDRLIGQGRRHRDGHVVVLAQPLGNRPG